MQQIVQSLFLQALAFALINSIWQMALLWLALLFMLHVFKLSAAQKFNIAFIAQLSGFFLFVYSLISFHSLKNSLIAVVNPGTTYINSIQHYIQQSTPFAGVIYLFVLMWKLAEMLFSYKSTQDLRKHNLKKMPAHNRIFVQQVTALLSLKKRVSIYLSSGIKCPLTIGFLKPVILVPLGAVNHLTKEQMEAVILHELSHIKRDDYLLNLVQSVIARFFFFNVFSKMINDIIEHERENACDDFVLQFRYNSFHYAEALLKLGRLQTTDVFAMAAAGKKENILLLRIQRLIHGNNKKVHYNFAVLTHSFLIFIIAVPLTLFSFKSNNSDQVQAAASKNIIAVPVVNKIQPDAQSQQISNIDYADKTAEKSTSKSNIEKENKQQIDITLKNTEASSGFINANQLLDSLKETAYDDALSKQVILNDDTYKKALSYQNFKQLEAMLYASGNSIKITEDPKSKNSYKKLITIEATDSDHNKNIYTVIVELYQ